MQCIFLYKITTMLMGVIGDDAILPNVWMLLCC